MFGTNKALALIDVALFPRHHIIFHLNAVNAQLVLLPAHLRQNLPFFSCLCASAKLYWQFDRNVLYCNHKSPWRTLGLLLAEIRPGTPKNGAKSATPGTQLRRQACVLLKSK